MGAFVATMSGVTVDQALELWRRGLSCIPVPLPRPGVPAGQIGDGKRPAIEWGEIQERLPTEAEIRRWFSTPSNIAIVTGEVSGIVVIDADNSIALKWCTSRLPYTPWQVRTSRSFHLYYGHPGIKVPNKAHVQTESGRFAMEIRGDGGIAIAPPSLHMSGHVYQFAGDWSVPRERLPRFWIGWFPRPKRIEAPRPSVPRTSGDVSERARRYLAAISRPEIGCGSDAATLYAACRLVRGFDISEDETIALLWEWAGGRPGVDARVDRAEG